MYVHVHGVHVGTTELSCQIKLHVQCTCRMQCETVCMSFWSRYAEEIYTVVKQMHTCTFNNVHVHLYSTVYMYIVDLPT